MHMARIAFQAPEMDYDATPVNVTLVLDASGSMDTGNRVAIAREAAEAIRRSLRSHDRIAVVHFSTDVLSQYTVARIWLYWIIKAFRSSSLAFKRRFLGRFSTKPSRCR